MDQSLVVASLPVMIGGLVGAFFMGEFIMAFSRIGVLAVNGIEAVGSLLGDVGERAYRIGWMLHMIMGVFFASVYSSILHFFMADTGWQALFGSVSLGAAHGFILSIMVVISIGEHHPYYRFRSSGYSLALIYIAAHVVYGLVVGTFLALR